MAKGIPIDETQFRVHLNHAVHMKIMFGGFQWYGPPAVDKLPQSNLLHGELFYGADDFHDKLGSMFRYCNNNPDNNGLGHALIYVFDGREGRPKFHHYLWTPETGDEMRAVDYRRAVDPNDFHSAFAFEALMKQTKAVKVSTVVRHAFKALRRVQGDGGSDQLHKASLRRAIMSILQREPLVFSKPVNNAYGGTMIEHLGIYDKEPTWL